MSDARATAGNAGGPMAFGGADQVQELYEELLALADKVGSACSEAYQRSTSAFTEACQNAALRLGGLQGALANQNPADPAAVFGSMAPSSDDLGAAQEFSLAVGGHVDEMARRIALAFLDAAREAALAAATADEEIGAASPVELVKAAAATRAELARKLTEAGSSAIRQLIA